LEATLRRLVLVYDSLFTNQGPVTDVDVTSFTLLFQCACVRKVSSCKLQKTIAFVNQRLVEKKLFFLQVYLQPWIFTLPSSAPLHIRRLPHLLTLYKYRYRYQNRNTSPISTNTDRLTKILYR